MAEKASSKAANTSLKKVDVDKLNTDIMAVMKKHGIANGIFVTQEIVNGKCHNIAVAQHTDRKKDLKLAKAAVKLFTEIQLCPEDLNSVTSVIRGIKQNRSPQEIADDAIEANMSPKDRKLLLEYREKKNQLVREQKYDEASEYRALEKKLMGKD
jgi:hypothetical protein